MPRLIEQGHCPHCGVELPGEKPRVCPSCGGSLQQRHLRTGCLSSGPAVLLLALLPLAWVLGLGSEGDEAEPDSAPPTSVVPR